MALPEMRREDGAEACDGGRPDDEEGAGRAGTRSCATMSVPWGCDVARGPGRGRKWMRDQEERCVRKVEFEVKCN